MHLVKLKWSAGISCVLFLFLFACKEVKNPENPILENDISLMSLPVLGQKDIDENGDEIDHTIGNFEFVNQLGDTITQDKFEGKIYISNFIFTTCPGICPKMTHQMKRVQDSIIKLKEEVRIISHTVDPRHDSISVLLEYGKEISADFSQWDFVTGTPYSIYKIAAEYQVVAKVDSSQEIPFVHSEKFLLIDKKKRIRGMYNGTDSLDVNRLLRDLKKLRKE